MIRREAFLCNDVGLHARPAALFVKAASSFSSNIQVISNNNRIANAKSLLDILTLGAVKGAKIEIIADGLDENSAVNTLCGLIENGFGESK